MTLIDRLSKLDGPDRGVDARIWCEVRGVVYLDHYPLIHETQVFYKEKGRRKEQVSGDDIPHAALYTASVDAALALAERVLPGHTGGFQPGIESKTWATVYYASPVEVHEVAKAKAATPAIALCIAILRAKEASHDQ